MFLLKQNYDFVIIAAVFLLHSQPLTRGVNGVNARAIVFNKIVQRIVLVLCSRRTVSHVRFKHEIIVDANKIVFERIEEQQHK